ATWKPGCKRAAGPGFLKPPHTFDRVVLDVGLRAADVDLPRLDRVAVEDRTARRLDRAAYPMLRAVLVDEAADGAAGCVVNARAAARADRDEFLLRSGGKGKPRGEQRGGNEDDAGDAIGLHLVLPQGSNRPTRYVIGLRAPR